MYIRHPEHSSGYKGLAANGSDYLWNSIWSDESYEDGWWLWLHNNVNVLLNCH